MHHDSWSYYPSPSSYTPIFTNSQIHKFTNSLQFCRYEQEPTRRIREATIRQHQIQCPRPCKLILHKKNLTWLPSQTRTAGASTLMLNFNGCQWQEKKTVGMLSLSYIQCPKSLTLLNPWLREIRNLMPYLIPTITFSHLLPLPHPLCLLSIGLSLVASAVSTSSNLHWDIVILWST